MPELADRNQIPYPETTEAIVAADPLSLSTTDEELVKVSKDQVREDVQHYNSKFDLKKRRERNEKYLFGEQERHYRPYEDPYNDNVIGEIHDTQRPMLLNKLPDLIVLPGRDGQEASETAENVSKVLNSDLHSDERKDVIDQALDHYPAMLVGVLKARWDPSLGEQGDYTFDCIHPNNIVVGRSAVGKDARKMDIIHEAVEWTVKEVIARFPSKKESFVEELVKAGVLKDEDKDKAPKLSTTIKVWEVHFTWMDTKDGKTEKVEAVMWRYGDCILKKMRDPNWDWNGQTRLVTYDDPADPSSKRTISEEEIRDSLLTGIMPSVVEQEQVFYNYLDQPQKPYFFLGTRNWGDSYLDKKTWLETLIPMQDNLDEWGLQLTQMLKKRALDIFSKESGLTAEDLEQLDPDDPDVQLLLGGDISRVFTRVLAEQPSAALFSQYENTRQRMYAKGWVNASRGEIQTDVATSNQIAREGNFTVADYNENKLVSRAFAWMGRWSLQFIKLRYTQEHFKKVLGQAGETTFIKINRDMIEDGMEVTVHASGTDKLRAERQAQEMAASQLIDPYNFYKDIGAADPKGRTEALLMFTQNPALYLEQYVKGNGTQAMAQAIATPPGAPTPDAMPIEPQQPTPTDTTAIPAAPSGPPDGSPRLL